MGQDDGKCQACGGKADGCLTCGGTGLSMLGIVRKLLWLEGRVAHLETELRWAGILPQK